MHIHLARLQAMRFCRRFLFFVFVACLFFWYFLLLFPFPQETFNQKNQHQRKVTCGCFTFRTQLKASKVLDDDCIDTKSQWFKMFMRLPYLTWCIHVYNSSPQDLLPQCHTRGPNVWNPVFMPLITSLTYDVSTWVTLYLGLCRLMAYEAFQHSPTNGISTSKYTNGSNGEHVPLAWMTNVKTHWNNTVIEPGPPVRPRLVNSIWQKQTEMSRSI